MITIDALSRIPGVRHGFFTRNSGAESFGQRNCAYRPGENAAEVERNRQACVQSIGTPLSRLVTVKQRHTPDALVVAAPITWTEAPVADALVTQTAGLSLGILTADCVPVLLADASGEIIAAAHAGWKGALDGVLENTVQAMEDLGAKRANIVAGVGPCIGQASYEVGPEFRERFVTRSAAYARYFSNDKPDGHSHFDLAGFAADRLKSASVGHVIVSGHDTCAEEAQFFSYRRSVLRQEPDDGRQLSAIAIVTG